MTSIASAREFLLHCNVERACLWLTFAAAVTVTASWCRAMPAMSGMPMPGGWTMSMMWMRMPGQSWPGMATSFVAMWTVMTAAMMLPSFGPMLCEYRAGLAGRRDRITLLVTATAGYFAVWTALGGIIFVIGVAIADLMMRDAGLARSAPLASTVVLVCAGALQMTPWKARQLACCRSATASFADEPRLRAAWRHGLALGWACTRCCASLVAVQMALGMMDLRVMVAVGAALTAERLAPRGDRIARLVGVAILSWTAI